MNTLFHIYGPFAVHSYGLAIAIGLIAFTFLVKKDPRFARLHLANKFTEILLVGIIVAMIGGRLLFLASNPDYFTTPLDLITFWQPGFSILGCIIALLLILPWYLMMIEVPIINFLDLIAIYAPLLQSISRTGCFFAGCCFGMPTTRPWGVIYTDTGSVAPLYVCLHPTQLYSAVILLFTFALMYFILQRILTKPGQLLTTYLMLISAGRFIVDFWRGDRNELSMLPQFFSLNQYIAAAIFIGALGGFIWSSNRK